MTLTELMVKKGLRAEDVSEAAGVAKSALSRFLNGEAMLSPANCSRIVTWSKEKVTLAELLEEHERQKRTAAAVSDE